MTDFTRWLEGHMTTRKITKAQLAAYIGTSDSTVGAWFTEDRIPSTRFCERLATYLKLPVEEVLRAAGHLPPLTEPAEEPEFSREARELAAVYDALDPDAREALTHIAQKLFEALPPRGSSAPA